MMIRALLIPVCLSQQDTWDVDRIAKIAASSAAAPEEGHLTCTCRAEATEPCAIGSMTAQVIFHTMKLGQEMKTAHMQPIGS